MSGGRVRERGGHLLLVLAGIILCQGILYGPSLVGQKILLPLDNLAEVGVYLPKSPEFAAVEARHNVISDITNVFEPARRFAASERRAGRWATWNQFQFTGAPVIWPRLSPFMLLQACVESPVVLAWSQMLAAIVAGLGAFVFFQRVLGVGFWPAAIAAWCYPLTAYFTLWQGFPGSLTVVWLPWIFLAVEETLRRVRPAAIAGLSAVTGLVLVSGALDVAGQVLLASGLFGVWRWIHHHRHGWLQRQARWAALALVTGWILGVLLATPYLLPVLEYAATGVRMAERSAGREERPPVGLSALPETVLPDMYGTWPYFGTDSNQLESAAAGYLGVLATLLVAPLAFCSRRNRKGLVAWVLLAFFALGWCLDVPGLVQLLRLPGLNMLSHNRMVFLFAFSVLALAALGLDVLARGELRWRAWMSLPAALLVGLCAWCSYRAMNLPEFISTSFPRQVAEGSAFDWVRDAEGVRTVQAAGARAFAAAAVWCGLGAVGWLWLWLRARGRPASAPPTIASLKGRRRVVAAAPLASPLPPAAWQRRLLAALGILLTAELLWFGYGRNVQADPALYYPPLPVLEKVVEAAPVRVLGHQCLPPMLPGLCGLRDIRGYDAVDPRRVVELIGTAGELSMDHYYAVTSWMKPKAELTSSGQLRLLPVLDMLGVRYLIFRSEPQPQVRPAFQGTDYFVMENAQALPRVFVPRSVEVVADDGVRLKKLGSLDFRPREVAYVEAAFALPNASEGKAEIVDEIPTRVTISVQMATAGLVVLTDAWDRGWSAYLDGRPAPILRVNHALRGVVAPAGAATIEFRYEPQSFTWGLRLCGSAAMLLVGWVAWSAWRRRGRPPASSELGSSPGSESR